MVSTRKIGLLRHMLAYVHVMYTWVTRYTSEVNFRICSPLSTTKPPWVACQRTTAMSQSVSIAGMHGSRRAVRGPRGHVWDPP